MIDETIPHIVYQKKLHKCGVCGGPCLITTEPSKGIATHQAIVPVPLLEKRLRLKNGWRFWRKPIKVIGPDTLLAYWQYYRQLKQYDKADSLRDLGLTMGLKVAFCQTHYEVHNA